MKRLLHIIISLACLGVFGFSIVFLLDKAEIINPPSGRSRESALRIQSASHVREIGKALLNYANANDGYMPTSLGQMGVDAGMKPQWFVSPRGRSWVPRNMSKEETVQWIDTQSDYVLIAPGAKIDASVPIVIVMEKIRNRDGTGLIDSNSYARWENMRDLEWLSQKQGFALPFME